MNTMITDTMSVSNYLLVIAIKPKGK